jgi:hypothetical protein
VIRHSMLILTCIGVDQGGSTRETGLDNRWAIAFLL